MEKRTTGSQTQQHTTSMYCNNCGAKGHIFRTCKDPVLSCGIILLNKPRLPTSPSDVRMLMVCRKDSMSYAEFMRGKYDVENREYINLLMKNMTLKEQAMIVCEPFETLWKQLWGDDRSSSEFITSREKFNSLNRISLMVENMSTYIEPEWGFPKGRRMRGESDLDCAIREFGEETNIPRDAFVVLKNILFEETFMGLNGIRYRHVYYLALLKNSDAVNLHQRFTPMQRREVSAIGWKSYIEADMLVRPHHAERRNMLEQVRTVMEVFEAE